MLQFATMLETIPENVTIADIRAKAGYTLQGAVDEAVKLDPDFPKNHVDMLRIERDGTRDYWKILALSKLYNVLPHDLACLLKPKKPRNKNSILLHNGLTVM